MAHDADLHVRPEQPGDKAAIWHVTKRAFDGLPYADGSEQDIVNALRDQGGLAVSLVAVRGESLVGHVAFSPAICNDGTPGWFTLGPVSVDPDVQRQGIGKRLIQDGLAALADRHAAGCIVVGDTNYYTKFGFVLASECAPVEALAAHFMVLPLRDQAPTCRIDFHKAFTEAT